MLFGCHTEKGLLCAYINLCLKVFFFLSRILKLPLVKFSQGSKHFIHKEAPVGLLNEDIQPFIAAIVENKEFLK